LLTDELKKEYHKEMINIILNETNKLTTTASSSSSSSSSSKVDDHSKSFGGTAEDSKVEKEAAKLLRGDNITSDNKNSKILPPMKINPFDERLLKNYGKWLKFDNGTCIMYINSLTKSLVSNKPDNFDEEDNFISNSTVAGNVLLGNIELSNTNGLPSCAIENILEYIDNIVQNEKKTPFIIDTSEDHKLRTFFSYKAILEDVSSLVIPFAKVILSSYTYICLLSYK
jgi:hypothetical protein